MKRILLIGFVLIIGVKVSSQTVPATDIKVMNGTGSNTYEFTRLTGTDGIFGGLMYNISGTSGYGNGNDFSIYTYGNRDMTFRTGTGNVVFFPSSGGKIGIGINTPSEMLHINGSVRGNIGTGALRIRSSTGYIDVGAQNSEWAHIYTDRPNIIFNKDVYTTTNAFSSYSNDLIFKTVGNEKVRIKNSNGFVGIGNNSPSEKLDVNGSIKIGSVNSYLTSGTWNYLGTSSSGYGYIGMCLRYKNNQWESFHSSINGMAMKFIANGIDFITAAPSSSPATVSTLMRIKSDGSLTVGGKILSTEVEVKQNVWSDFVFYDNYNLKTLEQVETFIKANGHLPDVPSEKEVKENGLNLGESDAVLLQKIEELTLYAIEQNKKLKTQESKIKALEAENQTLKEMQSAIEDIQKQLEGLKK